MRKDAFGGRGEEDGREDEKSSETANARREKKNRESEAAEERTRSSPRESMTSDVTATRPTLANGTEPSAESYLSS